MCRGSHRSQESLDPLKLDLQGIGNYSTPCRHWEVNLSPLEEYQALLSAEPTLQPPLLLFLNTKTKTKKKTIISSLILNNDGYTIASLMC